MDRIADLLQGFRTLLGAAAQRRELLPAVEIRIEQETWLLGEIEDIRDELGILRRVLEDQREVAKELVAHLGLGTSHASFEDFVNDSSDDTLRGGRVLIHHLKRIETMEGLANRCIDSVSQAPPLTLCSVLKVNRSGLFSHSNKIG